LSRLRSAFADILESVWRCPAKNRKSSFNDPHLFGFFTIFTQRFFLGRNISCLLGRKIKSTPACLKNSSALLT
jgi:hypothetical protein